MALVNNFRYGEVSQNMAGRIDLETYTQGVSRLSNAYVKKYGGISRRFPFVGEKLSEIVGQPVNDAVRIEQFFVSETEQYILLFRTSCINALQYTNGRFIRTNTISYPSGYRVTEDIIKKLCVAQYYSYLYIASEYLPLARLQLVGTNLIFSLPKLLLNQDGNSLLNRTIEYDYYEDGKKKAVKLVSSAILNDTSGKYAYTETTTYFEYDDQGHKNVVPMLDADGKPKNPRTTEKDITVEGSDDWSPDVLNTGDGYYPSGAAVISDRLWLYGCRKMPSTIWASRAYGTSQFMEMPDDSMLDFIQYHITETELDTIKDPSQWKLVPTYLADGTLAYFKDVAHIEEDPPCFLGYAGQATKDARYVSGGDVSTPLTNAPPKDKDGNPIWMSVRENKVAKSGRLWQKYYNFDDSTTPYFYRLNNNVEQTTYAELLAEYQLAGKEDPPNVITFHFDDSNDSPIFDKEHFYDGPYCYRPKMEYDLSNQDALKETITTMAFSATAATSMKIELNTGRNDRVMWLGLGSSIFVGTQSGVWGMPVNISPMASTTTRLNVNQSMNFQCSYLGSACCYLSKGRQLRFIDASGGSIADSDTTAVSEGILDGEVAEIGSITTPMPMSIIVMEDGTLRPFIYDLESGIKAWCRWDIANTKILSMCNYDTPDTVYMLGLFKHNGECGIGMFVYEDSDYSDVIFGNRVPYDSVMELNRMDAMVNGQPSMGAMKAIGRTVIRAYKTGRIKYWYDTGNVNITSKYITEDDSSGTSKIGDFFDDYIANPYGGSKNDLRLCISSVDAEPMNILAVSYEGRINL